MARWRTRKVFRWIEKHFNLLFVYLDFALRWLTQGKLGDLYDEIYLLWMWVSTYERRDIDKNLDKICIDQDGLHFKGESWTNSGTCNYKTCVAHDVVKEVRCPLVPAEDELPEGCSLVKGNCTEEFPKCCPRVECVDGTNVMIRRAEPVYWRQESYTYL